MRSIRRARRPLVALLALVAALAVGYGIRAADPGGHHAARPAASSTAPVALSALPAQVSSTVRLIEHDGPFPYPRNDGVVFHNDEHRLPQEPDGYYHEYTVPTPGSVTRGARRLVTGRDGRFWYTGDHYASCREVDLRR